MARISVHEFNPGDRVQLTDNPKIGGIVARVHTHAQKAGHDIVVVKIDDSKGREHLFVQARSLQLSSRLR